MRTEAISAELSASPDQIGSSAYKWMSNLPRTAWAWEWLRRNPDYQAAYRRRGGVGFSDVDPEAARWGLLHLEDPDLDARSANVFWRGDHCREVLPLAVNTDFDRAPTERFSRDGFGCRVAVLGGVPCDYQHVLFAESGRFMQLDIRGASKLATGVLLTPIFPIQQMRSSRILAIRRFTDMVAHRNLRPSLYPKEPRSHRLAHVMLALDGAIAGILHRDIAIALFGLPKVQEQWHGSANTLRDYVRRAIAYGRNLSSGGYTRFLR